VRDRRPDRITKALATRADQMKPGRGSAVAGDRGLRRLSHVTYIFGGTSEIMKTIIAREVTGLRT
jgi:alkylation response protein AidB-like acyl-CoA dehydrogenase